MRQVLFGLQALLLSSRFVSFRPSTLVADFVMCVGKQRPATAGPSRTMLSLDMTPIGTMDMPLTTRGTSLGGGSDCDDDLEMPLTIRKTSVFEGGDTSFNTGAAWEGVTSKPTQSYGLTDLWAELKDTNASEAVPEAPVETIQQAVSTGALTSRARARCKMKAEGYKEIVGKVRAWDA